MEPDNENETKNMSIAPAGNAVSPYSLSPECTADQLETANQRILLYLRALQVPIHKRYALADEALSRAAALHISDGDMVAAAMRCLYELLPAHTRDTQHSRDAALLAGIFADQLSSVESIPPLNRSNMIPVELERTGPIKFFFPLFLKMILAPLRPPLRRYFLALVCTALAVYYLWQYLGQ
jgi:hypothetical protein